MMMKEREKPETPVETTTPNPNDGKLKEEKAIYLTNSKFVFRF